MLRLRQTENISNRAIIGAAVNTTNGVVVKTYLTTAKAEGFSQYVEDQYERIPFLKARNIVPKMNAVRMSKLSFLPPEARDVRYSAFVYPYRYTLSGYNLGMAPLTNGMLGDLRPPTAPSFITIDTRMISYLLQRAYSKMSSAEYDFGVTVGEVAETAAFLAGPLTRIASLSSAALAGVGSILTDPNTWKGAKTYIRIAKNATSRQTKRLLATTKKHPTKAGVRIIDESANHWLAYKFGVLPLIDDVGKALDFRQNNVSRLTGLQLVRVKGPKTDITTSAQLRNLAFGYFVYDVFAVKRIEDRDYCGLYFRDKCNAPLLNFMEKLGFAPWQLPSLAYELIPLSFVVDRFIDIKSFVRGNIGSLTKTTLGSYHSRKVTTAYSCDVHNVRFGGSSPTYSCQVSQPTKGGAIYQQLARVINPDRPLFPVINPRWHEQLTADATNLSLIWGRLSTHVGKFLR